MPYMVINANCLNKISKHIEDYEEPVLWQGNDGGEKNRIVFDRLY